MDNTEKKLPVTGNDTTKIDHKPEALMASGIVGFCFALGWNVFATAKVVRLIDAKKAAEGRDKLTWKEVLKIGWKYFLPSLLSMGLSITAIIMGNRISAKRIAALTAAYGLSETALGVYREKVKEIIGEAKEKQVNEETKKEVIAQANGDKEVIITNDSEQMFFEPLSGRYFKSTWNDLEKTVNELNHKALNSTNGWVSMNDWFEAIGLPIVEINDNYGWGTIASSTNYGMLDIELTTHITKEKKVIAAVKYRTKPYELLY